MKNEAIKLSKELQSLLLKSKPLADELEHELREIGYYLEDEGKTIAAETWIEKSEDVYDIYTSIEEALEVLKKIK